MAEQDRYGAKFGIAGSTLDSNIEKAKSTLDSNIEKAKSKMTPGSAPTTSKSNFGLGYDGRYRLLHLASKQGIGAEQDRYDTHFGYVDAQRVKSALESVKETLKNATSSKNTTYGSFGMGHDGQTRLANLINKKGVGAEQDRYANYFSVDTDKVGRAKDQIVGGFRNAGEELKR